MPWSMKDAPDFTKKAATPKLKRTFAKTANAVLAKTGDEASAVKIANAQVKKMSGKKVQKAGVALGQEKRKQKLGVTRPLTPKASAGVKPAMLNKASFA